MFQVKSPLPSGISAHVQCHGHMIPLNILGVQVNRIFESGQARDQSEVKWAPTTRILTDHGNGKCNNIKNQGNSAIRKATKCKIWGPICPTQMWVEMWGKSTATSTDQAHGAHPAVIFKHLLPRLAPSSQSSPTHTVPFWTRKQVNISSFSCQESNPTSLLPTVSSGPPSSSQKLELEAGIWVIIPRFQRQRTCWWG